jgi:acyl-CoA synthetase (AMP-forming)/AMP-acid ligase II
VPDVIADVLEQAACTPDACALIDARGRRISYGVLGRRIRETAGGLRERGLEPGDALLFSIRPGPDALVLALATVAAGATVVFADPGAGADLYTARAHRAGARFAAAESLLYAAGGTALGRRLARRRGLALPDLGTLTGPAKTPSPRAPGRVPHPRVVHLYSGPWLPGVPRGAIPLRHLTGPPVDGSPDLDAPAVVIFTSGTTGAPRGVVHTLRTLSAGLGLLRQRCELGPGDVVHTDQLMLGLPALAGGACWSLPGTPLDPARYAHGLTTRGATHAFLVPGDAARVLGVAPRWPGVRSVVLGAAPVVPALLRRVRAAAPDAEILCIYGLTEAPPVAFVTAEEKLAHPGPGDLLGTPADGVTVTVRSGELTVTGPQVCPRYLDGPGRTEGSLAGPSTAVATGDLGEVLPDGRVVLLGRAKDMIIRREENIYPGLYEPRIAALPGVADALLVGLADPATGDEEVVLALVLEAGARLDAVSARLPEVIGRAAFPDRVVAVPAVPRSGRTHKPDREALRCALR